MRLVVIAIYLYDWIQWLITRAKTNVLNPNESNIPKTNEYSNIP